MKYIVAIFVIIFVVYGFFFSLIHIGNYGSAGIIIVGVFGYILYHIFKAMYEGYKGDNKTSTRSSSRSSYNSQSTYTSKDTNKNDDEIDEMIILGMLDGDLDGKFDFSDKD